MTLCLMDARSCAKVRKVGAFRLGREDYNKTAAFYPARDTGVYSDAPLALSTIQA
jgi:hypothetical protein